MSAEQCKAEKGVFSPNKQDKSQGKAQKATKPTSAIATKKAAGASQTMGIAAQFETLLLNIANTKSTKYSASEILKALKQLGPLTLDQFISLKDKTDDELLEAIIAILALDPKQFEVGIVIALDTIQHIPAGSIKANAAYAALAKIDPSKLTEANRQVIQAAKNKLEKTEADAARAEKQSAAAAIEQRQAAAALIQEITKRPIARKDLSSDQLNALSSSLAPDQRIITFKDGQNEVLALIEWRAGKWQIAQNSGKPEYTIENQGGKIIARKSNGFWKSDKKVEARLVVDSYWNDMELMGMSYSLYQDIWADQSITRSEFKRIPGAIDDDASAYNFFSTGGVEDSDGTSAARAKHFYDIFTSLNKMTAGYDKVVKKQIFAAYVSAKGFIRVPTKEAAGRLLNGEENTSATALLDQVSKANRETATKVIQIVTNNYGRREIGGISLIHSQVEQFLANMSIYAQSNVDGFSVDTSNIPKVTDPSGKTTRNIALLKNTEQFLAWLKGDKVAEEAEDGSGGSKQALATKFEKLKKDGKYDKALEAAKKMAGDKHIALGQLFDIQIARDDLDGALKVALAMDGKVKESKLKQLADLHVKAGEKDGKIDEASLDKAEIVAQSITEGKEGILALIAAKYLKSRDQNLRVKAADILKKTDENYFFTGNDQSEVLGVYQQIGIKVEPGITIGTLLAIVAKAIKVPSEAWWSDRDLVKTEGAIIILKDGKNVENADAAIKQLEQIVKRSKDPYVQAYVKLVLGKILAAKANELKNDSQAEAMRYLQKAQASLRQSYDEFKKIDPKLAEDSAHNMAIVYNSANVLAKGIKGTIEIEGKKIKASKALSGIKDQLPNDAQFKSPLNQSPTSGQIFKKSVENGDRYAGLGGGGGGGGGASASQRAELVKKGVKSERLKMFEGTIASRIKDNPKIKYSEIMSMLPKPPEGSESYLKSYFKKHGGKE